ncbi:hypothetical protein [Micromonospora sp. WMMD1274]|uniref:hypothetical protein n=1 Tax=Micromonospora sp. WMMD1274 TaxID=3404116 RepID=UPI003B938217
MLKEPRPPRSVLALTGEIVAARSAQDLPILSVVTQSYYEDGAVREKMAGTVQARVRRQLPTAFDPNGGSLVLQLTLVLLNGVAAGAFDAATAERGQPVADRLARCRLWWRLRRRRAASGADTPLPPISTGLAAQIAGHARRLARRCGMSEADASRYATELVAALTD